MTVIYNQPKDTAAFEKYYREVHLPLVSANQQEIGFTRADLTKFNGSARRHEARVLPAGGAVLPSLDDAKKGMATAGLQEGRRTTWPISRAAGSPGCWRWRRARPPRPPTGEPMAIVTVIYKQPKDPAAFEKHYAETHVPLVGANQARSDSPRPS